MILFLFLHEMTPDVEVCYQSAATQPNNTLKPAKSDTVFSCNLQLLDNHHAQQGVQVMPRELSHHLLLKWLEDKYTTGNLWAGYVSHKGVTEISRADNRDIVVPYVRKFPTTSFFLFLPFI
jgi:hypothetical protein